MKEWRMPSGGDRILRSMLCCLCALAVLMQCTPRRHAGESLGELICGLDLERNDLILELGTAVAVDNERTEEIVSRSVAVIPELRAALLNPPGKVAGFSAFCLAKVKTREARAAAMAARQHWQAQPPTFDSAFAVGLLSLFITSSRCMPVMPCRPPPLSCFAGGSARAASPRHTCIAELVL